MWDTITGPLYEIVEMFGDSWKKLVATLLLFVGGWIAAKILKLVIVKGLKLIKLDVVAAKAGIEEFLAKGGAKRTAIELLGSLVYWIAMLIVLVMILGIWNIDIGLSQTLIPFLPKVFAAILILILGLFIASLLEDIIRAAAANAEVRYAVALSKTVKWILVVFVVLTAISQLEIDTQFVTWGFLIILGALGLASGLAFGLGAKDIVARRLESWISQIEKNAPKPGGPGA